jgi:hypothetical protein
MYPVIDWEEFGVHVAAPVEPESVQIGVFDGAGGERAVAKGAISTTWL